ncbi:MAG: tRNA (N6-threonylcarbamoyladenosine(37)-N6)-methyltransferase TrmO [Anaerolineae bacterium]
MDEEREDGFEPILMVPVGYLVRDAQGLDVAPGESPSIEALRAQPVKIVIQNRYADALLGLEEGADILVLCHLHRASRDVLQVHPRGDRSRPLRGVFATRSPVRPNPISVTTARILSIRGTILDAVGLDVLDGTPILDIKHHSSYFDTPYES